MVASKNDVLWLKCNRDSGKEIDIDEMFNISEIKCMKWHGDKFYILANKHKRILGYYLLEIDI